MSEQSADELRLRATEAQMRRALGLGNSSPVRAQAAQPVAPSNAHRRHFVRDGEVPVTVIHHDEPGGATNKLEAARQALREQVEARAQVERRLEEAQAAIQALQTQLAHERIASQETLRRTEDQRQQAERQLHEERAARQQAEQQLDQALASRQEAEVQLPVDEADEEKQEPPAPMKRARKITKPIATRKNAGTVKKPSGKSRKARAAEPEFVEWWKSGWQERYR